MTRTTKLAVFGFGGFASLVVLAIVASEMWWKSSAYGAGPGGVETPSFAGIVQLLTSLAGAVGFTWAGVKTWLASKGINDKAISFAKVAGIVALVETVQDGPTKSQLISAGRAACDELRDQLFPGVTP